MTIDQVVEYANHKYGEIAYLIETDTVISLYTSKGIWKILKNDLKRFGHYTLCHKNHYHDTDYYHRQCTSMNLPFLVYYAVMHDYGQVSYGRDAWKQFQYDYEMFCYGQRLFESCATFNFFCD